ncbi:MAG: GTP cyclohydrolase I FolE [Bacteroidota bacterium]|nr:GTP cyclohydrolase I FolE [Bacteroidota bacterium]
MYNTQDNNQEELHDEIGDGHILTSMETPLRADAFALDDDTKVEMIQKHFKEIMHILGLDLTDDSLKGTPARVAKMYVKEVFSGLNPTNKPKISLFENKYHYKEMVVVKDITFYTMCEHHFVPFFGKAHVAYIPNGKVAGLSKVNRLVQFLAKRPQVQERLTMQIAQEISDTFHIGDVAVLLDAQHLCVSSRGVQDVNSSTITSRFLGIFNKEDIKNQFLDAIK